MKAAVRVRLLAAFLAGVAALAALIVGPALPGHLVSTGWVSATPHSQAAVFGPSHCHKAARHHRDNPDYVIPPECVDSMWNNIVSPPPGDAPPPPGDASPPPGDPIGPAAP
jgi:hypothetical protein